MAFQGGTPTLLVTGLMWSPGIAWKIFTPLTNLGAGRHLYIDAFGIVMPILGRLLALHFYRRARREGLARSAGARGCNHVVCGRDGGHRLASAAPAGTIPACGAHPVRG